ncbi:MAG: transposase [Chloroflexi bacterium]|nr:transposase [Chloroflexota bacterium]
MPKYRFRILEGKLAKEVRACIRIFSGQSHCEIVELNVQKDPVHLIIMVPPKVSISELMGRLLRPCPFSSSRNPGTSYFVIRGHNTIFPVILLCPISCVIQKLCTFGEGERRISDIPRFRTLQKLT